jgi:hypothetical protein
LQVDEDARKARHDIKACSLTYRKAGEQFDQNPMLSSPKLADLEREKAARA